MKQLCVDGACDEVQTLKNATHEFPKGRLLALACAGFITILTEALPAGLLPQIGAGLRVSGAAVGQLVTIYAIGSMVAAIPLTSFTQSWRRKSVLLLAVSGFLVANTVTAVSGEYEITLVARFIAGVSAGLLWALLAGYASRMVPSNMQGRAIAVAMVGTPLALSFGIPLGTLGGIVFGWRATFGILSALTVALIVWIAIALPDFPGERGGRQTKISEVIAIPGVAQILAVTLLFVLAHNIIYTYIVPFSSLSKLGEHVDLALFGFGVSSILGIWIVGVYIDRKLRSLTIVSTVLFGISVLIMGVRYDDTTIVALAILLWGLSFGGAATLFQTASARSSGSAADLAQSMIVTVWNAAIAGGGAVGAGLLMGFGVRMLPWAVLIILVGALVTVLSDPKTGFTDDGP
ncbi:MFS transporter [Gluconacetobacter azotocaptans]|uniref:MFS transporter n=1 Tax=Gluconacetobacter azotocaptans TaxID=142834 RepID=UPI001957CBB6|nr:MFS transporter [Gluconacetobacter azotocaptans]MBM9400795.1 MFS transporter [Gluconacetobacter azotocaptans]